MSAKLFRRQGFSGTSVAEITTEVDTALSSLYYFFPQGKEQLCEEALRRSGAAFGEFIEGALDSSSSWTRAVHNLFTQAAEWLVETDFVEGSPIATVALEVASSNKRYAWWQPRSTGTGSRGSPSHSWTTAYRR